MDYSQLSDFEINLKVAHIVLGKGNYDWNSENKEVYLAGIDGGEFLPNGYFDPCNNAADAWPIIFKNKVMLSPHCADDEWKAQIYLGREDIFDNYASAWHKNPLRAAMIVFLMMQDAKHA